MAFYLSIPLWILLAALGLVVCLLPRSIELCLGRGLGRIVLKLGLFKSRVARENIERCLPELSSDERLKLLHANYEHYGILFFEFLHFFCVVPGHFRRYAQRISRLENKEIWDRANAKGKGVLFFSAHLGFWEMTAAAAGLAGIAPTIVTRVLKPRWLHNRITACRASTGVSAAFHPGSLPTILRALRKGGSVAFMNDQYASPPMGEPAIFFGMKVNTLSVIGQLAKRTGAAVLPVSSLRGRDGIIRVRIEPELDLGPSEGDASHTTQAVANHVEAWVRHDPEQWLWLHRRFKNVQFS